MKKPAPKKTDRSGWVILAVTLLLYLVALLLAPEKAATALQSGLKIIKQILPVLLIVFFLTALLNTFIRPGKIAKQLGKEHRFRSWFIALTGGVISHGPGYIWYPMLSELRGGGVRDGLIVAFFYARAIKLPWLPVMISYFGLGFTALFLFYILLGAWLQGIIAQRVLSRGQAAPED